MDAVLAVAAILMGALALVISAVLVRSERRRRRRAESDYEAISEEYGRLSDAYDRAAQSRDEYFGLLDKLAQSRPLYGHDEDGRYTRVDTSVEWPSWVEED